MISALFSRIIIIFLGTLYPAYASYKAIRTKDVKEYVKWMMYWIVFALFITAEMVTDVFLGFWFPFYYELKIVVFLWLLSPATEGSSILYRKFVHPILVKKEQEIDGYLVRAKEESYKTVMELGSRGFQYASRIIMETAVNGGGGLMNHLRRSYSVGDLSANRFGALPPASIDENDRGGITNLSTLHDMSDSDMDEFNEPLEEIMVRAPGQRANRRVTEEVFGYSSRAAVDDTDTDTEHYIGEVLSSGYSSVEFLHPEPPATSTSASTRRVGRSSMRSATTETAKSSKKVASDVPSYATLPRPRKRTGRSTSNSNRKA